MTQGETSFWEDKGAGLTASQLGTSPPRGPGQGEGRRRRPHSPALIFDFEERCFQSGHWKGRVHTLASVCSSTEPALHTQEMLREARPCQSLRASELEHTLSQGVPFYLAEGRHPLPAHLASTLGERVLLLWGEVAGCPDSKACHPSAGRRTLLHVGSVGCPPTIRNLAGGKTPAPAHFC